MLEPPEIDLCFAISATAVDANNTFKLMKDIVDDIVENYGMGKIRYSVISFGSQAKQLLGFDSGISDPEQLRNFVRSFNRISGEAALDKALETALESFKESVARPNSKKVLVVIVDNESGLEGKEIQPVARELAERNIRVVAVAVGDEADNQELELVASDKRDVLSAPKSIDPKDLSKDIMVLVLTGTLIFVQRKCLQPAEL